MFVKNISLTEFDPERIERLEMTDLLRCYFERKRKISAIAQLL